MIQDVWLSEFTDFYQEPRGPRGAEEERSCLNTNRVRVILTALESRGDRDNDVHSFSSLTSLRSQMMTSGSLMRDSAITTLSASERTDDGEVP